jgi:hypothetical protein
MKALGHFTVPLANHPDESWPIPLELPGGYHSAPSQLKRFRNSMGKPIQISLPACVCQIVLMTPSPTLKGFAFARLRLHATQQGRLDAETPNLPS